MTRALWAVGLVACSAGKGVDTSRRSPPDDAEVSSDPKEPPIVTDTDPGTDSGRETGVPTDSPLDTDSAAPAPLLPHGRDHFVVTMFGGASTTSRWSILRTLDLTPEDATSGTVESTSWAWYQASFSGDAHTNKVDTGYTTAGGTYTGVVKTPLGFEPGAAGTPLHGTYALDAHGQLTITWESGKWDTWALSEPLSHPTSMISLVASSYDTLHAWGFGSTAPLDAGASIAEIAAAGDLSFQDLWGNAYDSPDYQNVSHFPLASYLTCSSTALMVDETQDLVCDRWHSYVAGDPAVDGRRSYWNHQLGEVGCAEAGHPCPDAACAQVTIGELGGHTLAMLQVLDDDGVFRGWVATEASLHGRYEGGALVAASYWLQP